VSPTVHIRLRPMGVDIEAERGTPLQDLLFSYGVEFPCGGHGKCKGCRVRVLEGSLPLSPAQERMLSQAERDAGWRLSCQCQADDLTLELAQWEAQILADTSRFAFTPREGCGVAIDIGTTTIVAQLLDMTRGEVLAVRSALNPQARFGADIMSRVSAAVEPGGRVKLVGVIREQIAGMIAELLEASGTRAGTVRDIVLVGNTVMHNLFCDVDVTPLSYYPFEPVSLATKEFSASALGWNVPGDPPVRFLAGIGGFVGSDVLAGVFATGMHEAPETRVLVDLGTNGEIVVGNRDRMICASTAAGPAFEGARIYMGMRAATGAVSGVRIEDGALACHVLGNVPPRGICGSGLVDAVACALRLDLIRTGGRFTDGGSSLMLMPPVKISQTDIRELQLAKGAIAAGIRLLTREFGVEHPAVHEVLLAGAFGNYVDTGSARRIGLLPFAAEQIKPSGNTALLGAKMALFAPPDTFDVLARRISHVSLSELEGFQDTYVDEMIFPGEEPDTL
jgi:uncharacterized 2Fe-2S/4Fe-4S cluster protein (DUF4445 family)